MAAKDPATRSAIARMGALTRWSKEDGKAGAAVASRGFLAKFEREIDPEQKLPQAERLKRAQRAMTAHMIGLSLASAKKRRERST